MSSSQKNLLKLVLTLILFLSVFLYAFFMSGNYLNNLINTSFIVGLVLVTVAASIAIFFSGSLNLLLAGFSKKVRDDLLDRARYEDRKNRNLMDADSLEYYAEQDQKLKKRRGYWVFYPFIYGLILIGLSFILLFFV